MRNQKLLLSSVAAIAMAFSISTANAETVHTETYVQSQGIEGATRINFADFDLNKNGVFSKPEVGKKLFYVFDTDGNEVIDNIEWDKTSMYTITPMEKQTFKFVDFDDDGNADTSTYTYETFYDASGLIRFDQDKNGLSASEFINVGFQELDDNDNNTIELDEWEEAYTEMTSPPNAEQERYRQ